MPKQFFELYEDIHVPQRWLLGPLYKESDTKINCYQFMQGVPVAFDGRHRVSIYRHGTPLDFSHLVGDPVPVVSRRVAEVLNQLAADHLQVLPVSIESQVDEHYLINATHTVKCIDDTASAEVQYWRLEDGRPDKVGKYSAVHGMRVNPELIPTNIKIFRPQGWTIVLLISEEIRDALERIGATGTRFIAV